MDAPWTVEQLTERRRGLDLLESRVMRLYLKGPDAEAARLMEALRYVISFARLMAVRNEAGQDVDVSGPLQLHSMFVTEQLGQRLSRVSTLWDAVQGLPDLIARTRAARASLLRHVPLDPASLEEEICTRKLAIASGGGGGAGYIYPGVYHRLERAGLVPDLMVGTSIGALMSMFRARRRRYDQAPLIAASRRLSWSGMFRVLETESRYGLPATLRLYLRSALGPLFMHPSGRGLWLSDMEIPLYVVASGITVDALKHDLHFYEHLLDTDARGRSTSAGVRGMLKTMAMLREFMSRPDALVEVVLGRAEGTEDFDVMDAAGFSAAIPGVLHYDVLRPDARMKRILDTLYSTYGITRLGEGGMVANVPSRVCWETIASGTLGHRNSFVLALDCFPPTPRRPPWMPLASLVRLSNVRQHNRYADLYMPLRKTLSPMNLVPSMKDAMTAMRWGREALDPHIPFIKAMMKRIPTL